MGDVSRGSAHDLTLDTVDTPSESDAQMMVESTPELMLRLDDLSQDGTQDDHVGPHEDEQKSKDEDDSSPLELQARARRGHVDRDAKRMETRLQHNLKQQQAHYARQRKLFENFRVESCPFSNGSNSPQSSDDQERLDRQPSRKFEDAATTKFCSKSGSVSHQRTHFTRLENHTRHHPSFPQDDTNDDDDSQAQNLLRRIKEKARAQVHHQRDGSTHTELGTGVRPVKFFEEMQQQEASNDALRRQLELLRRLQLENNRFRQETRSLRERNKALDERDEIREQEAKRLREEVCELNATVQRDHASLATAAQTTHQLKMTQKRLTAAQAELREFQIALQDGRDARDQLQSESQLEIADLTLEVKRLKRNTKHLRQQEQRRMDEMELYKKTIAALEQDAADCRAKLKHAKREIAQFAAIADEKTAQCESVETTAADCVKRMEKGMETLQKTNTQEREKRKKVENASSELQMQNERMQAENTLLLEKQRELEQQLALFHEHWKERKHAYQDQLKRLATQLEEHVAKHKSDAVTIGSLREQFDVLESHLGDLEAAASDLKSEVAEEARARQKQLEALRRYVERALHDTSDADDTALADQVDFGRSRREEVWQVVPELEVVQAALSALRNETMNVVHELQRARHLVRQQGSKLALAVERTTEFEQLRAEDAAKLNEIREQRKLAEQAREIVMNEKLEVLKWSERNCEKSEALTAELTKCGQLVLRVRKELHDALDSEESRDELSAEPLGQSVCALKKQVDALVSRRDHWRAESEKQAHDVTELQSQVQSLKREMEAKLDEFKQTVKEVERVHNKNAQEQKLHFEQCLADVENERKSLELKLQEESAKLAEEEKNNEKLQHAVKTFEEDLPVFATILHIFVLVVQPLILQVSDLLAQKRYLVRENAEFAQAHEQIECIGEVLKEMIPAAAKEEKGKERQRRRVFRRVVITVFAINRFQHFASHATDAHDQSLYGYSASLKGVKSRKRACTFSSQATVIKVLPPIQTLSSLSLRPLLERLKKMEITEKVADLMALNSTMSDQIPSYLGNLILKVVIAINPASKEILVANTNGMFHCQALLGRRRRSIRKRGVQHEDRMSESVFEDGVPTVTFIRQRILALGKRVEDLHYQRNSLQKENYEFQFQLDRQATSLKDMEVLLKKTEELQYEMATLRSHSGQELERAQQEQQAKKQEMQAKEDKLIDAQAKIETLQAENSEAESRIMTMEAEKVALRRELDQLKSNSMEEEEKSDKSKAAARRQEEEVRSLKQAVKKAHELYQKVSMQLEQEVQEKSTLQTMMLHLRRQQEKAERELREEKIRELETSFNDDKESDREELNEECYIKPRMLRSSWETQTCDTKAASPTTKSMRKATFAPVITTNEQDKRDQMLMNATSRRQKCDHSVSVISDQRECVSPSSSSVSPLPSQLRSKKSRSSEEDDTFRSEWQQLRVSRALSDTLCPAREVQFQSDVNELRESSAAKSPGSSANLSWESAASDKSRRRLEVDKVNTAVHDYMDRIDNKLNKMYGIPPSSAIQRSSVRHGASDKIYDNEMVWETGLGILKDEIRVQQYHSDVESYDD